MSICANPTCVCGYLPPHILSRLLTTGDERLTRSMYATGRAEAAAITRRMERPAAMEGHAAFLAPGKGRSIYDMDGKDYPKPGRAVRGETDPDTADRCVNEAFAYSGRTYDFYREVFGRRSLDDHGYPLTASVHYGMMVSNAFWDGSQMIYGDGDGQYFLPFTRSLSIVAHELTHGVVNFTSNLAYDSQSGALNESFCDVMAALVVQWDSDQTVDQANWTLGKEVLGPLLQVPGLRTFLATPAYQGHPLLGDDPQPKHMSKFDPATEDYGGVHINSGIPNHAFYLAAQAIGGKAWGKVGKIWFEGFLKLGPKATFEDGAEATVLAAKRLFPGTERAVRDAWANVGVEPGV